MADPFTPKFIDLVRNFTSTSGTGPLVLDEAASGFTSFTSALQPGDSFYYSVAGLEKTSESEVGRGTLQADGTISRQPMSGAPTNFSLGRKSVALVAAAEWFDRIEASSQGAASAASRAALASLPTSAPVFLSESGREGLFLFDGSNRSAQVSADTAQGIYVAPASDATGASGAWVRKFDGAINVAWFGLVNGDNSANGAANTAAAGAALAVMAAAGGPYRLRMPAGTYWFSDNGSGAAIDLSHGKMTLEGPMGGAALLKFPSGVTAIRVHGVLTSGADTKDASSHTGAAGSAIRNLILRGAFDSSGVEAEAHGIQLRDDAIIDNVVITRFEGDGIHGAASTNSASGANPPYGNVNKSIIKDVTCNENRNGIYFNGSDSNACTIVAANCTSNRQWGIWDSSFLGNSYFGGHHANNARQAVTDGVAIPTSMATHGGNQYFVIAGQESWCSTNAPSGTTANNQGWAYWSAGGTADGIPAWFSGIGCRAGGSVCSDNVNARSVFDGLYAEGDQAKAQIGQLSLVVGGVLAEQCFQNPAIGKGTSILRGSSNGQIEAQASLKVVSGTVTTTIGGVQGNSSNNALILNEPTQAPSSHRFNYASNTLRLTYGSAANVFRVTGPVTSEQFGTGAAVTEAVYIDKLMVGDTIGNARKVSNGTAAPASGEHGQGEWVFYRGTRSDSAPANSFIRGESADTAAIAPSLPTEPRRRRRHAPRTKSSPRRSRRDRATTRRRHRARGVASSSARCRPAYGRDMHSSSPRSARRVGASLGPPRGCGRG